MVPNGWKSVRLNKLSEFVTSGSRDWAQYYSDKGSKFIRMTNLPRDGIYLKLEDLKFVDVKSDSAERHRIITSQTRAPQRGKKALMQQLLTGKRRVKIELMEEATC